MSIHHLSYESRASLLGDRRRRARRSAHNAGRASPNDLRWRARCRRRNMELMDWAASLGVTQATINAFRRGARHV